MKVKLLKLIFTAMLSISIALMSNHSWAASSDAVYSTSKNIVDVDFTLQGVGKKSVFFQSVFEVGYYQEKNQTALNPLEDVAKHLEVHYFINIPGKKLFNYNIDVMKDNYSKQELLTIADEIDQLQKYFVDLKKGDCYQLTYIPQIGTRFELNGALKGIIKGRRFAEILFAVWFGERPFDKKIKQQILSLRDKALEEHFNLSKL